MKKRRTRRGKGREGRKKVQEEEEGKINQGGQKGKTS